jgi:hypothetical protein
MHEFSEDLLQFVWKHRLLKPVPLVSCSGNVIEVISPGDLNTDSGPDFFNGQIRLNGALLAGNIEVHIQSSDWNRHQHQQDKAYDNIILHVVYEHNKEISQNSLHNVEVLELKELISKDTISRYRELSSSPASLPCARQLPAIQPSRFVSWLEKMSLERLEKKIKTLEILFNATRGDYTQTFYSLFLRSFGFKVNAEPFELLARHLPLQILLKHSNDVFQLEALLLGTAGFLDRQVDDKYLRELQNEFEHLRRKYNLVSLESHLFKFSRLRPANFPSLRLAQFAQLLFQHPGIFAMPHHARNMNELQAALYTPLSGYWKQHYNLDSPASEKELQMGKQSMESIMINVFSPFYFFYGLKLDKPQLRELAVEILKKCAPEDNFKTRLFVAQHKNIQNAASTQGIINLYDNYCTHKKCLSCALAQSFLCN